MIHKIGHLAAKLVAVDDGWVTLECVYRSRFCELQTAATETYNLKVGEKVDFTVQTDSAGVRELRRREVEAGE